MPETAEVGPQYFLMKPIKEREEGNSAMINPPAHAAGVQPFKNEASRNDRNGTRLGIVNRGIAAKSHGPVWLRIRRQRREAMVADGILRGEKTRHWGICGREKSHRWRIRHPAACMAEIGVGKTAHGVAAI